MADYATLVFDIDSGPARTAATDLAKLNQAAVKVSAGFAESDRVMRNANGTFASSAQVVAKYGDEVYNLASRFNPALKAVYDFQKREIDLNRAVEFGVRTKAQAKKMLADYAAELRRSLPASKAAEQAEKAAAIELQRKTDILEKLNSAYTPLYATSKRYEASLDELNAAQREGIITSQQYASMLATLNANYARNVGPLDATVAATERMSAATRRSGIVLQNAGYQVGDFFVQIASGQNALMAASQQIPQLLGSWGKWGAIAGAGVAVVGALVMTYNNISTASETLTKSTDRLSESNSNLRESIDRVNSPMKELYDKFGPAAAQVRALYVAQTQLNIAVSRGELSKSIGGLADAMAKYTNATSAWGSTSRRAFDDIKADLGLTGVAASDFVRRLREINQEASTGLKIQKFQELVAWLEGAGIAADKLSPEFAQAALQMTNLNIESIQLEKSINDALIAAGKLPGQFSRAAAEAAKITARLNEATSAAARLAASSISDARYAQIELDFRTDAVGKAGALAAAKFDEEIGKNSGIDSGLFNKLRADAIAGAEEAARIMAEVERRNAADRAANSSGGGAQLAQAQKQFQSLRELLEQETLFEFAEWEKRQAQLDMALAKRLLSEQNYQIMKDQLQTFYFGTEMQKNALNYQMSLEQLNLFHQQGLIAEEAYQIQKRQLQWQYAEQLQQGDNNSWSVQLSGMADAFGQMNQLAGGGYDSLLKAQRIFGAASALISTYTGAAEALKLPFPANIAAMGKVLAAGMGLVSAIKSGSSSSKGSSAASSATTAATKQSPTQYVTIDVTGDSWAVGLVEGVIEQIQQQTKDGRVVFMGNGR